MKDEPKQHGPKHDRHDHDHHHHHPVADVRGTVTQYLLNPRGEVDGLLLADDTLVKFPPHLARELVQVARAGDEVHANGHREGERLLKGHVVVNAATGVALREFKPAPPERAGGLPVLQPMRAEGRVRLLRRNPHGDADGAILEDGTLVHFPPHAGRQFAAVLAEGQPLAAAGFGTANEFGRSLAAATLGAAPDALAPIAPPRPKPRADKDHLHPPGQPPRHEDATAA